MRIDFTAEVWRWESRADSLWTFVSVPREPSELIRELPHMPRGFGSIRVGVRIGASEWTTSIFPESADGTYALPVKRSVREAEGLSVGDECMVTMKLLDFQDVTES